MAYTEEKTHYGTGGIGLAGLLTVLFVALKLIPGNAVNHWSWWWVLSPIWISWLLFLAVVVVLLIVFSIIGLVSVGRK